MKTSYPRIALVVGLAGVVVAAAIVAAGLTVVFAQAPPQGQAVPKYTAGTTAVEVDVIVRDKDRRFVADLRAEDFEILDDGVPQKISVLYREIGPGEQVSGKATTAEQPMPPPPPPQQVQRVLVFYFDQPHLEPGGFNRARTAAIGFLQKEFRQGDVGGIVNGSTMVNNRLTSSREELEAAVQGIKPAPEASDINRELRTWPRFVDVVEALRVTRNEPGYNPGPTVLDDVVTRACRERPDDCQGNAMDSQVESKAIRLVAQARLLGKQTLDTVAAISNGLARLPGRKTLILLSDGFFTEDTWADLRAVVGRAAHASVRIYSLDTRGLNRGSAGSDILSAENTSHPEMSVTSFGDIGSDGPNSLAVDTGGYVIRNENDFGKAFTEIDRDTSSYYILGFHPSKPPDGKFHDLKVSVRRSGLTVRARKGYIAYTDADAARAAGGGRPAGAASAAPPEQPGRVEAPVSPIRPPAEPPVPPTAALPPAATPAAPPAAQPGAPAGAEAASAGAVRIRPRTADEIESIAGATGVPRTDAALPAALRKVASEGWTAYSKGDVEKAKALLAPVAQDQAAPPWTHYVLGWSQLALGEETPAAANWEKVRAAVPAFEPVYFDLADAYQRQGDFSRAIAVLREAERRWPGDVEVYSAIGVVQLARGAVDDAIATFTKGVGVNGKDANVCYNLAKTYEVRYVRSERLRKAGPGSVNAASALEDRTHAITYYQRVLVLGGPLVESAKEGLKRLGQE